MGRIEILEHTADIGIRVECATVEELFSTAALGLQSLAVSIDRVQPSSSYPMSATGEDLDSLLVNWLNEVLFYLDARRIVIERFEVEELTEQSIRAVAWGESRAGTSNSAKLVVKAATYHQLKVTHQDGLWVADIYFDI